MAYTPNHTSNLSIEEVDKLINRYFEAQTTEEEELLLKNFIASPQATDARYDEIKAVLGFIAKTKSVQQQHDKQTPQHTTSNHRLKVVHWSAAAALFIIAGVSVLTYSYRQENQCVAYIGGQKTTDPQQVIKEMHKSIKNIGASTGTPSVETQLNDVFKTIENENQNNHS